MIAFIDAHSLVPAASSPRSASYAEVGALLSRAETIDGLGQFTRAAEIVGLERLLRPGERYTIFAPNDEAFAKLAPGEVDGLLEPTGHERLLTLLSHHILPQRLSFDDLVGEVGEVGTLAGQTVTVDGAEVVRIGGASMVETDLEAKNGVLHVIDRVLPISDP